MGDTVEEIASKMGISEGSDKIFGNETGMRPLGPPITDQGPEKGEKRLFKKAYLLIGDKNWVYTFEPQRRSENSQWRGPSGHSQTTESFVHNFLKFVWYRGTNTFNRRDIYYWEVLQEYCVEQHKRSIKINAQVLV